jgi:thiamine biosynthesis protein ThiS
VRITLNGEPHDIDRRLTVIELLSTLDIDPRRVAVEHNRAILKRHTFPDVIVGDGDTVEIVNFVGGG